MGAGGGLRPRVPLLTSGHRATTRGFHEASVEEDKEVDVSAMQIRNAAFNRAVLFRALQSARHWKRLAPQHSPHAGESSRATSAFRTYPRPRIEVARTTPGSASLLTKRIR
jgi:hypothetical protein